MEEKKTNNNFFDKKESNKRNQIYFRGTVFKILFSTDNQQKPSEELFILAETYEKGMVFQIIGITGYYAGKIEGYVRIQPEMKKKNIAGVTKDYLIEQLKEYVFGDFNEDNLEIIGELKTENCKF